jgi:hypothetical protein
MVVTETLVSYSDSGRVTFIHLGLIDPESAGGRKTPNDVKNGNLHQMPVTRENLLQHHSG